MKLFRYAAALVAVVYAAQAVKDAIYIGCNSGSCCSSCATKNNPTPPLEVAKVAADALDRRRRSRAPRPGGTSVGIARARDLKNRVNLSDDTIARTRSFFARHDTPQTRAARRRDRNSPAAISWDLWGGDAMRAWLETV